MKLIYILSVRLYALSIVLASFFNKKAKLRYFGIRETFKKLKEAELENAIWFHCASLGEFEQGRSLIEMLKSKYPEYQIAVSFFSSSGYEVRKNYEHADLVFYLPSDSRTNAKKLLDLLKPEKVFFIKYEFWYFYLKEIHRRNIPLYLVSGIFRTDQIFFRSYGLFFRNMLQNFTHMFVQNHSSKERLEHIDKYNVTISGDTRFDRVYDIAQSTKTFPIINKFAGDTLVFIAGSTWKPDEDLISAFINETDHAVKFIIAPHEIKEDHILRIIRSLLKKAVRYSELYESKEIDADVLIIDNIGMLSSLYAYGHIAYIGGGFGAGIHNTLEAAVFGIPVIFGPKYQKFDEAAELIKRGGGFSIAQKDGFFSLMNILISDACFRKNAGKQSEAYVIENVGATQRIMQKAFK